MTVDPDERPGAVPPGTGEEGTPDDEGLGEVRDDGGRRLGMMPARGGSEPAEDDAEDDAEEQQGQQ